MLKRITRIQAEDDDISTHAFTDTGAGEKEYGKSQMETKKKQKAKVKTIFFWSVLKNSLI